MVTKKPQQIEKSILLLTLSCLFLFSFLSTFSTGYSVGPNYINVSVDTTANITNARPEILNITLQDPITLTAGGIEYVQCNASIRDWNGGATLDTVNGTFFHSSSTLFAANDNNTHYTNSSCAQTGVNGFYANYTCTFPVLYYANASSWNCTIVVNDTANFVGNDTFNTTINALYALNVTTTIDYGDLAIEDTSPNRTANVTNFGNQPINVSVYGYGNETGDGLSMVCEQGNISIGMQKYSASIADNYAAKTNLTGTGVHIPGLTMLKQTTNTQVINTTYWQLYVPPNPFGVCNGTVVFQAEVA